MAKIFGILVYFTSFSGFTIAVHDEYESDFEPVKRPRTHQVTIDDASSADRAVASNAPICLNSRDPGEGSRPPVPVSPTTESIERFQTKRRDLPSPVSGPGEGMKSPLLARLGFGKPKVPPTPLLGWMNPTSTEVPFTPSLSSFGQSPPIDRTPFTVKIKPSSGRGSPVVPSAASSLASARKRGPPTIPARVSSLAPAGISESPEVHSA